MSDFSYAFTQFEEMKEIFQELLWEETQGSVDCVTDFYRFQYHWYEDMQDDFFDEEAQQLLAKECNRMREHE